MLKSSFLRISAGIADRVPIADENFLLALSASLPLAFPLHSVVELYVLLVLDFVVTKVVVVVGCHITRLLILFLVRVQSEC